MTIAELLEKITPKMRLKTTWEYGCYVLAKKPTSSAQDEANVELFNRSPALARSHEALVATLKRVFSNIAKYDHQAEDGTHFIRCKYCDAIGTVKPGASSGHIPHTENCLITVTESALAEAEKVSQ